MKCRKIITNRVLYTLHLKFPPCVLNYTNDKMLNQLHEFIQYNVPEHSILSVFIYRMLSQRFPVTC